MDSRKEQDAHHDLHHARSRRSLFRLNTILAAFPEAQAVALPEVVPSARKQVSDAILPFFRTMFPNQFAEHPMVPEPMQDRVIYLEGPFKNQ